MIVLIMILRVLPPDVNESFGFLMLLTKYRFGMGAIKNVGKAAVEEMVRVREESGRIKFHRFY